MMLDNIDHYTARIRVLDEKIAELCEPYERQIAQLDAVPGYGITTAQDIIAEIGTGMSVFPTQLVITHALLSALKPNTKASAPITTSGGRTSAAASAATSAA
jgi:transposase